MTENHRTTEVFNILLKNLTLLYKEEKPKFPDCQFIGLADWRIFSGLPCLGVGADHTEITHCIGVARADQWRTITGKYTHSPVQPSCINIYQ
jgi:hypothetical protein